MKKPFQIGDRVRFIKEGSNSYYPNDKKFCQVQADTFSIGTIVDKKESRVLIESKGEIKNVHVRLCKRLKPKKRTRKEVRTIFVNAYLSGLDGFYRKKEAAENMSLATCIGKAIPVTYTVEVPVGEGEK